MKYLCIQHRSTSVHKTETNRHKRKKDSNTIIVGDSLQPQGDFNTPLTPMDRSSKQKTNKETQVFNDTLDEMNLLDIFRTFYPNAEEYTFFSSTHGLQSWQDPCIFADSVAYVPPPCPSPNLHFTSPQISAK